MLFSKSFRSRVNQVKLKGFLCFLVMNVLPCSKIMSLGGTYDGDYLCSGDLENHRRVCMLALGLGLRGRCLLFSFSYIDLDVFFRVVDALVDRVEELARGVCHLIFDSVFW